MQERNFDQCEDMVVELKELPGHARYLVLTDVVACNGTLQGLHFGTEISVPIAAIVTSVSVFSGLDLPLAVH